ncbi:hypothetical protein JQM64_00185 [Fournierella massiliensis]|nr:hypothetical protein [Fournierella massiliensis]MCF2555968.1 hypothetical protein [Fournierella massiliensis]
MYKSAQVANFNIVFGDEEKPMLDYFDSVIIPALTSGISKVVDDNEYRFMNINISKSKGDIYVLTGILVKKTILEIKSDINEAGELVEKDEKYSAAPYSSFVINLLNHRMIFMPNQKGSPSLSNFRSTVKYVIDAYTRRKNTELEDDNKLEYALINVVGIPSAKTMDELLENVEKINSLTLRFYPLNGDIDYSDAFGILTKEMREEVGSKRGEIVFKSPKSISGVKKILEKAAGTIDPILRVVTKGKSKATLKDYELSEKYQIEVGDDMDIDKEGEQLVDKIDEIDTMQFTSELHAAIYERNKGKIIPFVNKRR